MTAAVSTASCQQENVRLALLVGLGEEIKRVFAQLVCLRMGKRVEEFMHRLIISPTPGMNREGGDISLGIRVDQERQHGEIRGQFDDFIWKCASSVFRYSEGKVRIHTGPNERITADSAFNLIAAVNHFAAKELAEQGSNLDFSIPPERYAALDEAMAQGRAR